MGRRYRKKPAVVEAVCMSDDGMASSLAAWPQWLKDAWSAPFGSPGSLQFGGKDPNSYFELVTLEGVHKVSKNDWIIQGVEGELYPCKPSVFERTYTPVEV